MRCTHKKTLQAVKDSGNEALTQVKENQKQLLDDCRITAAQDTPVDSFVAAPESGHGRIEHRECRVFDCLYTTDPEWQPLIAQIIEVRRIRERKDTKAKQWKSSTETAFYVSTAIRTAQEYHLAVRGHWGIENKNHRVRDGTMLEDASRIRNNPGIMARCRSLALNILRANGAANIAQALYQNAICFNKLKLLDFVMS